MNQQLKRILDLVRRTGDRMVVTDPNGADAYVIMGLDQYEELISAATHEHCDDDEDGDNWNPDFPLDDQGGLGWSPEMYGDLIPTEPDEEPIGDELGKTPVQTQEKRSEDLPEDLKAAVEHDLAILESWRREKEAKPEVPAQEPKKTEPEQKNDIEEDRFYLEPIE